ncbi:UDP-glucuronic acid decarboxylase [Vigna angularis]|uniref:UDP-glucuronic acid decarboxylase n=1 Tax=Phaseolus angularis TaxID=3914 RepID=A0A8T0KJ70_PHAAN|nr:UDP-glucuronic acid decarboxylase [Vigna angularis]
MFCEWLQLINPDVEIKMVENTPDDPRQRKPDITKAKELLGWEPKVKLRDGLPLMEENVCLRLGVDKKNEVCEIYEIYEMRIEKKYTYEIPAEEPWRAIFDVEDSGREWGQRLWRWTETKMQGKRRREGEKQRLRGTLWMSV